MTYRGCSKSCSRLITVPVTPSSLHLTRSPNSECKHNCAHCDTLLRTAIPPACRSGSGIDKCGLLSSCRPSGHVSQLPGHPWASRSSPCSPVDRQVVTVRAVGKTAAAIIRKDQLPATVAAEGRSFQGLPLQTSTTACRYNLEQSVHDPAKSQNHCVAGNFSGESQPALNPEFALLGFDDALNLFKLIVGYEYL